MGVPIDTAPEAGRPIVTISIILANIAIYILTTSQNLFLQINNNILWSYGYIPAYFPTDQGLLRIFTSMFLHADPLHIFFNMYFLYIFGKGVENTLGGARFLVLYILSGVSASLLHTASLGFQGVSSISIPAVGASGAISGVLGAYLMLYPTTPLAMCFFLVLPLCGTFRASTFLLFWFVIQVFYGYLRLGGVAFFAHAGGFVAGIALSWILGRDIVARIKQPLFYTFSLFQGGGEGLGGGAKLVLAIAIISLIGGGVYSYMVGASIDRSQLIYAVDIKISENPGQPPYSSSIATLSLSKDSSDFSMSPIADDASRILINRLLASRVLVNLNNRGSEGVDINRSGSVIINNIPVPFSITARASYDSNGVMVYGYGSASTRAVGCDPTGRCGPQDYIVYPWFEVRSTGPLSLASLISIPLIVSMIVLVLSLYVVVARDREVSLSSYWSYW